MLANQVTIKAIQDSKHKIKSSLLKLPRPFHHAFLSHSVPVSFCSKAIKSPTLHNTALCHKYDKHSQATVVFGDATW